MLRDFANGGAQLPVSSTHIYVIVVPWDSTYNTGAGGRYCYGSCGYHTSYTYNGVVMQYAVIGNPVYCVNHGAGNTCRLNEYGNRAPNWDSLSTGWVACHKIAHNYEHVCWSVDCISAIVI